MPRESQFSSSTGNPPLPSVNAYSKALHADSFPGSKPQSVKEVAIDGHEKVAAICPTASGKRIGRPRKLKRKHKTNRTNGWLMATDPRSHRISGVSLMKEPENNASKIKLLKATLPRHPNCDCFIHDRNCSFLQQAQREKGLEQIKFYPTDRWHGSKHRHACPCAPRGNNRLHRRAMGLNTSISEQTFSWFRNYTRTMNTMFFTTHMFYVL